MPTITPSYIYTFFAMLIVSSILISSFSAYVVALKTIPEIQQLENLLKHVASQGYRLITLTNVANSTSRVVLELPSAIGSKQYWFRLCNDSSRAWVEGALGPITKVNVGNQVPLPNMIVAIGNYSSVNGPAVLESYWDQTIPVLHLIAWSEKA